ncbi:PadR family transcriptional regulator [Myxacorys almedinensis]|uniref:PadR family transcriptional regulator n=1 Tax=Myxacorys almedinensis A TaxID=2690445 RepID=A0A8J7YYH9_9CYAN|nr:PadR family transcriptional regulator [Myxacorys almedinensis]NDJ16874.1 PadR family transcriptional regulator [Myxacorys almedinensis A]
MRIQDIYHFFQSPQPVFLNQELAVCYIAEVLAEHQSYGTELIQHLEARYPKFRLSDTVLCAALKFLEREEMVTSYWKKVEGRGRPRRMYELNTDKRQMAQNLAHLWQQYATKLEVGRQPVEQH